MQLWFGELIHGVMESAYRIWSVSAPPFPWPCHPTEYPSDNQPPTDRLPHDIGTIGDVVEGTLRAQGKSPRSRDARSNAYARASRAVNELGPHLFPLISSAEEKVIGSRAMLSAGDGQLPARANLYELHGVIDVLTNVQLGAASTSNPIRQAVQSACAALAGEYEVIVDYKGSRRPPNTHRYWQQGEWQVQMYAWLRTRQPDSLPVAAGVLLYLNELAPVRDDLLELKHAMRRGTADRTPVSGSQDAYLLSTWQPGSAIPEFSLPFRLARAIRVVPVTESSQIEATAQFDSVVFAIEQCVALEAAAGKISRAWQPLGDDESCASCDFRYFCPDPHPQTGRHEITSPHAP